MELRKVGECVLLRSRPGPTLPFLLPSSLQQPRRSTPTRLSPYLRSLQPTQPRYRNLTTSTARRAEDKPAPSTPPNPSNSTEQNQKISTLLDSVLKPPSPARSSDKPSAPPPPSTSSSGSTIGETSASMLSSHMAEIHRSEASSKAARQGQIAASMRMPGGGGADLTSAPRLPFVPRAMRTIKSRPSVGRTVDVRASQGLAAALQLLQRELNNNRVQADQRRGRFYERKGKKRKRLKTERWRKRFMEAFRATIELTWKMRRQGW